jgi:hypothetical protein
MRVLDAARAIGVEVSLDGDDLVLMAPNAPPADLLEAFSREKAEIITRLRSGEPSWLADDWLVLFDERAAILEFDGGLLREFAELQAIGSCILNAAMSETSGRQIERFIRSLPNHIAGARVTVEPRSARDSIDPGEPEILETTP